MKRKMLQLINYPRADERSGCGKYSLIDLCGIDINTDKILDSKFWSEEKWLLEYHGITVRGVCGLLPRLTAI
jgi:hypothetical protein